MMSVENGKDAARRVWHPITLAETSVPVENTRSDCHFWQTVTRVFISVVLILDWIGEAIVLYSSRSHIGSVSSVVFLAF